MPDPALHTRPLVRSGLLPNISCMALCSACGRGATTLATNRSGRCGWGNASRPLVPMNSGPVGIAVATRRFSLTQPIAFGLIRLPEAQALRDEVRGFLKKRLMEELLIQIQR